MNISVMLFLSLGLSVAAIILAGIALFFAKKAKYWRNLFEKDHHPENLEEIIESIAENIKKLRQDQADTGATLDRTIQTLQTALQFVAIERFDSGSNDGGNLSFSIALLNGQQTGTIITSLYGREHNRIYCKGVVAGKPQQQLSDEEQAALINALTNNH